MALAKGKFLARHQSWRGEFQNLSARRDPQYDAAPQAVEPGEGGPHGASRIGALKLHGQAAERAMRMRGISVHKPEP